MERRDILIVLTLFLGILATIMLVTNLFFDNFFGKLVYIVLALEFIFLILLTKDRE